VDSVEESLKKQSDRIINEGANNVKEQVDETVKIKAYNSTFSPVDQVMRQLRQAVDGSSATSGEGES